MLSYSVFWLLMLLNGGYGYINWCDDKRLLAQPNQANLLAQPNQANLLAQPNQANRPANPRAPSPKHNLPTPEMIKGEGYPVETHYTTTQDGYILALHRIPCGRKTSCGGSRPAILLMHGLLCSSSDWVVQYPAKGLGYILADAGYDVWLGNFRGNTYSRNHTSMDPDKPGEFWEYTLDEMAKYDLPATIEKLLQVSGEGDLLYLGHGMGATAFMAMQNYREDLTRRVRLAAFLGPMAYVSNMISPISWLAAWDNILGNIYDLIGDGEFLPSSTWIDCIASFFCRNILNLDICENALFLIIGPDSKQMNSSLLETILHHTPAGVSSKTVLHFAQGVNTGGFHGYDWGNQEENEKHHGPGGVVPEYSPSRLLTPVSVFWGDNDWLADPLDVQRLVGELGHLLPGMEHEIDYQDWNHMDFLWGIDAPEYVYGDLLSDLEHCAHFDCWSEE